MARGLGCVEYSNGLRRYFVHCETSGGIFPPLFDSPKEAQETYRQLGVDMCDRPKTDHEVVVVKFARISGWDDNNTWQWKFDRYGLATGDTFLEPRSDDQNFRCLQLVDNTIHVAERIDGGFSGQYEVPRCDLEREDAACDYNPHAENLSYEESFSKPMSLCPECSQLLIGR